MNLADLAQRLGSFLSTGAGQQQAFGTMTSVEEAEQARGATPIANALMGVASGVANIPRKAMQNSQFALDTGTYDPGPTLEAAMLPMGTGAIAGVPVRGLEAVLGAGPIRPTRLPSSSSLATPPAPTADVMARSRLENVDLASARGTQPKMDWDKFEKGEYPPPLIKGYENRPIAVRREDGEYLIFDGHHRTARALADGQKNMEMYVIDAKDYAPEFAGRKPSIDKTDMNSLLKALLGE